MQLGGWICKLLYLDWNLLTFICICFLYAAGGHCGGDSWQVVTCGTSEKHLPINLCSAKAGEDSFSRHFALILYSLFEQPSVVWLFLCPVSYTSSQHRRNSRIKVSRIFVLETFPYFIVRLFWTWCFPVSTDVGIYAVQAFTFISLLSEVLIFRFLKDFFLIHLYLHYQFSLSCFFFASPHLLSGWAQWLRHCFLIQDWGPGDWMQSIWHLYGPPTYL